MKAEHERLSTELQRYHDCDPEVMEQMKEEAIVAKEAANRWTGINCIFVFLTIL